MRVLNYKGARIHTVSVDKATNLRLVPGKNEVEDDVFDKLLDKEKGSDSFQELCACGEVVEIDQAAVTETETDDGGVVVDVNIPAMAASKAIDLINSEINLDVLNSYMEQETKAKARPSVMKAIDTHIKVLQAADNGDTDNTE